jgi:hypothetical protein
MNAKILDQQKEGAATCYLCKISLQHYIDALPHRYMDYDIQREIVHNVYLDSLVTTVLSNRHIPPIVLVADALEKRNITELHIKSFKILDGLQRTYRLKAIKDTIQFCATSVQQNDNCLAWSKFKFSKHFSKDLEPINSTTEVLREILEFRKQNGTEALSKQFSENYQWFEVWADLSPSDEVRKMLTLNAGHKPVTTRHSLELLFLNLLPILKQTRPDFDLVREREISGSFFSKNRKPGSFHFAHLITSLLSFYEGEAIGPSTELIQSLQSIDAKLDNYASFTTPDFLRHFVSFLVELDELLDGQYGDSARLWMGREVSLAALFGALGAYAKQWKLAREKAMEQFLKIVKDHPSVLDLKGFERSRNSLDLSKINFGKINRTAVFNAVKSILEESPPITVNWSDRFAIDEKSGSKRDQAIISEGGKYEKD